MFVQSVKMVHDWHHRANSDNLYNKRDSERKRATFNSSEAQDANVAKTSKKQRVEMLHKRPDLGAVDGHRIGVKSFFIF